MAENLIDINSLNDFTENSILPINLIVLLQENWNASEDQDVIYTYILGLLFLFIKDGSAQAIQGSIDLKNKLAKKLARIFFDRLKFLLTLDKINISDDIIQAKNVLTKMIKNMHESGVINPDSIRVLRKLEEYYLEGRK